MSFTSMNVLISSEKYKKFRVKCLQEGKAVKKVISELIDIYVEDEEDEPIKEKDSGIKEPEKD